MTVDRIDKDVRTQGDAVFCIWFEEVRKKQELHRESFSPAVLETYNPTFGVALI